MIFVLLYVGLPSAGKSQAQIELLFMPEQLRVLICGGGIGGLTTALSLARSRVEVAIYELAEDVRALGVGINLLPHAVRVLTELGLAEELERAAYGRRSWLITANTVN